MITEAKEIFSDINFFDSLFRGMNSETTLEFFKEKLSDNKKVKIENFDNDKFELKINYDRNHKPYFIFSFELKNKKPQIYYPSTVRIEYNYEEERYQVESVEYTNKDKKIRLSYALDDIFENQFKEKEKVIYFFDNLKTFVPAISIEFKDKKYNLETQSTIGKFFDNYLHNLNTQKEITSAIKRLLFLRSVTTEQQDLDMLKYDFKIEDSIFSGFLNKASNAFIENYTSTHENNKNNKI